jgi:hypothetical protein
MLACLGLSPGAAATVAPEAAPAARPAPCDPALAAAPLADLSSLDPALALAAARGLCERTGGTGALKVRVQNLGGGRRYEEACDAEVGAGAVERLLACLAWCHCASASSLPVLESAALCVRNLCARGENREAHRRALFPAFDPLAVAAASLAADEAAASGGAADAVWLALGNLMLRCSVSQCASGLRSVPSAVAALTAFAARRGEHHGAASFLYFFFDAAAAFMDAAELKERAHAAGHACQSPLLAILCGGCPEAAIDAARALAAVLELRDATACREAPCAQCTPAAPLALQAVARALSRHATAGRVCESLAGLLSSMRWGDCGAHADVQRALGALLACLGGKAPAAAHAGFVYRAALALWGLTTGELAKRWEQGLFSRAFAPLAAALSCSPCRHEESAAGALCYLLGSLCRVASLWQLRAAIGVAPAVAAALQAHSECGYVAAGAAHFFACLLSAADRTYRTCFAPRAHWSLYPRAQAAVLPLMPVFFDALARPHEPGFLRSTRVVSRLLGLALGECAQAGACSGCRAMHDACLPATPHVLAAMGHIAARAGGGGRDTELQWAALSVLRALTLLEAHQEPGPAHCALVQSALEPLVLLLAAFSEHAAASDRCMHVVHSAAAMLAGFLKKRRSSSPAPAGAPPEAAAEAAAAAAAAAAAPETARAELRAHHLPALRAAAARLQDSPAPSSFQRLLALLGADAYVLLHLPPLEAAARMASCLECWRAEPRRACSDAAAHGEQLLCAICRADEAGGAEEGGGAPSLLALHCGHLFHRRCLLAWLAHGGAALAAAACCPLDRAPITRLAGAGDESAPGCTLIEDAGGGGGADSEGSEESEGSEG